jgi:transketolase
MRNAFFDTITGACGTRDDIFVLSGDGGLGVFDSFQQEHPDRFLNMGVAEQNMVSFSAGLAMTGLKPYMYNIVPFVLYRCYEQVRNDICYQRLGAVMVGVGSGVAYAPAGMTHYSVEDLGVARTLPNLTILSPADPIEARLAAEYSLSAESPVYVRLAKRGEPNIHTDGDVDITLPQEIEAGERVAIVFHGSIGAEVLQAGRELEKQGVSATLISVPMIQPLNMDRLSEMLAGVECVVSVEEHFVGSGLGSILCAEYARLRPSWRLFTLGISDGFIHEVKDVDGMRDHFGISAEKISKFVMEVLGQGS